MAKYITTDTELTSIANAIRTKGGTSASLEYPSGFISAIQNIPSEGGGSSDEDVIFIDYDGSVVDTKSKAEINAMTSDSDLPANPTHTGLTAQGWNWTVAQLKAQLTAMPDQKVYVGQMYVTTSGATEIDVVMQDGRLNPTLTICVNGTVEVDWGDNTTPDTVTGSSLATRLAVSHIYVTAGAYTISISVVSGTYTFYGSSTYTLLRKNTVANQNKAYSSRVLAIRIGNGISQIGQYAFSDCYSLESITIPSSVTTIGQYAFTYCYSLESITIPNSVTTIEQYTFSYSYSLKNISIAYSITTINTGAFTYCYSLTSMTISNNVVTIGTSAFSSCYSIISIVIPSGVTSIGISAFVNCRSLLSVTVSSGVTSIGNSAFSNCTSLTRVTIPSSVTTIGDSAFSGCYSITSISIPSGITSINNSLFQSCYSLDNVIIPSSVTSIGKYAFNSCYSLKSITIPNNVANIGEEAFSNCRSLASVTIPNEAIAINSSAFSNCYSLAKITIQGNVTNIGNNAFSNCYGVSEYHVLPTSVPTAGTTIFDNIVSDCVIYVPRGKLTDYQTATNWSEYSSYMQEEPAT